MKWNVNPLRIGAGADSVPPFRLFSIAGLPCLSTVGDAPSPAVTWYAREGCSGEDFTFRVKAEGGMGEGSMRVGLGEEEGAGCNQDVKINKLVKG